MSSLPARSKPGTCETLLRPEVAGILTAVLLPHPSVLLVRCRKRRAPHSHRWGCCGCQIGVGGHQPQILTGRS